MSQIGKYQLVKKLATGGMAEVHLARAAGPMGFEKTLVVKRILPHLAEDPSFVQMFLGEAKLAAQLNHPNVVQIFDFGESEGQYFIAMEFIDGPNLRGIIRRAAELGRALPFSLAAKTIAFAAEGLAYAHDFADPATGQPMGLIHRDVSPDNILMGRNGAVKVVDFGIAKAASSTHHTKTGTLKGKLAYMPPEQLQTQPLDRRADVFALGMVLYELTTGHKPFDATTEVGIMKAILYEPFIPATGRRPDVPPALERIIDRALAKDRDQRYPSCRDLQVDLEQFILASGEPVPPYRLAQLVVDLAAGATSLPVATPPPGSGPTSNPALTDDQTVPQRTPAGPRAQAHRPETQPLTAAERPGHRASWAAAAVAVALLGAGGWYFARQYQAGLPAHERDALAVASPATAAGAGPHYTPPGSDERAIAPAGTEDGAGSALPKPDDSDGKPAPGAADPEAAREAATTPSGSGARTAESRTDRRRTERRTRAGRDRKEDPASQKEPVVVARAEPARASFRLESSPTGQVRVNGRFMGVTPVVVRNLEPGEVKVEVSDARIGFRIEDRFTVRAGDNGTRRLVAEPATLEFRIRPYATVYLDDRRLGQTPFAAVKTWEGRHAVKLVNQDLGKEITLPFDVKPGANVFKYNLAE